MPAEHPELAPGGASHRDARRIGPGGARPALAHRPILPSLIPPGRRPCGAHARRLAAGVRVRRTSNLSACKLAIAGRPACGVACAGGLSCDRALRCNPRRPPARRPVPSGVARMTGSDALQHSPAPSPTPGGSVIVSPASRRRPCRTFGASSFHPEFLRRFTAKTVKQQRAAHKHLRFAKLVPKAARGVFSDTAAGIAAVSILPEFYAISEFYPRIP